MFGQPSAILTGLFGIPADQIHVDTETHSAGFSGAVVTRVVIRGREFSLRQWPHGTDISRQRNIHALLAHISRRQGNHFTVPVPIPIRSLTGDTLVQFDGMWWQLEPWLPGRADFHQNPSQTRLKAAVRATAMWHVHAATFKLNDAHDGPPLVAGLRRPRAVHDRMELVDWFRVRLARLESCISNEPHPDFAAMSRRLLQSFKQHAAALHLSLQHSVSTPVPASPCIRDLWHDHVLFNGDEVSGLIDFGATRTDTLTCDLVRLLGSLVGDDADAWQYAVSCYNEIRPLSRAEQTLFRPLDHSGVLLSGMTWLKRRYLTTMPFPDMARVCDRLTTIMQRLDAISAGTDATSRLARTALISPS